MNSWSRRWLAWRLWASQSFWHRLTLAWRGLLPISGGTVATSAQVGRVDWSPTPTWQRGLVAYWQQAVLASQIIWNAPEESPKVGAAQSPLVVAYYAMGAPAAVRSYLYPWTHDESAATTRSHSISVVAWYSFQAPAAAAVLGWNLAQDQTPIPPQPTPVSWTPVKAWTRWTPQPEYGWTPAGDAPLPPADTPPSLPNIQLWKSWRAQADLGWSQAQDQTVDAPPVAAPTPRWKQWAIQPEYGWTPSSDVLLAPSADTPPSWTATRAWARWAGQPWYGWTVPSDVPAAVPGDTTGLQVIAWYAFQAPAAAVLPWPQAQDQLSVVPTDVPLSWSPVRAWTRWTPQPEYGWTPSSDVQLAVQLETPPAWTATRSWGRWAAQPQCGWTSAVESAPIIADLPSARDWTAVRPWTPWRAQPWYGWTAALDPGVATQAAGASIQVIAWYSQRAPTAALLPWPLAQDQLSEGEVEQIVCIWDRGWTLQPWLGWNLAVEATPSVQDLPSARDWTPAQQWAKWKAQPVLGWVPAGDQGVVPTVDGPPAWIVTKQWARWAAQPQFGWGADVTGLSAPSLDTPINPVLQPYLFLAYRRQPWLGWSAAVEAAPIPLVFDLPPQWTPVRQWQRFTLQPEYGWAIVADQPPPPPPAAPKLVLYNWKFSRSTSG